MQSNAAAAALSSVGLQEEVCELILNNRLLLPAGYQRFAGTCHQKCMCGEARVNSGLLL